MPKHVGRLPHVVYFIVSNHSVKVKVIPQQAELAQGVPVG